MGSNNSSVLQMKLNNPNKLRREESFSAFPNGTIFPSPNQLFQYSDATFSLITRFVAGTRTSELQFLV
jgi:hypothetical protein